MGTVVSGYASLEPLPWSEIVAYQDATGIQLSSWEAETVRKLSEAYASQRRLAEDIDCAPPYTPEMTPERQRAHAKWLRKKLRG